MQNYTITRAVDLTPAFTKTEELNGVLQLRMANDLKNKLADDLGYLGYISKDENVHIAQCSAVLRRYLNPSDQALLRSIGTGEVGEGVAVFMNLPFEPVSAAPLPGELAHTAKLTSMSEHILLAFSDFFGPAYGVASEGSRLVNDLIPSIADREKFTGNGSRRTLGLHVENAALRFAKPGVDLAPKYLLLTGVSAQSIGGPTTPVAIASRALSLIEPAEDELLRGFAARLALPIRQRGRVGRRNEVGPVPLIIGSRDHAEIIAAFYGDMIRPVSEETSCAIRSLEAALQKVTVHLEILPGTLVFIANGQALHGRSYFEPRFDQFGRAERWIQRLFGTGRLSAFYEYQALSDRVFDIVI